MVKEVLINNFNTIKSHAVCGILKDMYRMALVPKVCVSNSHCHLGDVGGGVDFVVFKIHGNSPNFILGETYVSFGVIVEENQVQIELPYYAIKDISAEDISFTFDIEADIDNITYLDDYRE